jgi:hypothetical protein
MSDHDDLKSKLQTILSVSPSEQGVKSLAALAGGFIYSGESAVQIEELLANVCRKR